MPRLRPRAWAVALLLLAALCQAQVVDFFDSPLILNSTTLSRVIADSLYTSSSCAIDSACVDGYDYIMQSVVQITHPIQGNFCSGTLVRGAKGESLVLTARHCVVLQPSSFVYPWSSYGIVLDYRLPCGSAAAPGGSVRDLRVLQGLAVRFTDPGSDVAVLEVLQDIPPDWTVTYAGWDSRALDLPRAFVDVSQPSGDAEKTTLGVIDGRLLAVTLQPDGDIYLSNGTCPDEGCGFYTAHPTLGGMQDGSSGSAVVDADTHRVVGVVTAGGGSSDRCASEWLDTAAAAAGKGAAAPAGAPAGAPADPSAEYAAAAAAISASSPSISDEDGAVLYVLGSLARACTAGLRLLLMGETEDAGPAAPPAEAPSQGDAGGGSAAEGLSFAPLLSSRWDAAGSLGGKATGDQGKRSDNDDDDEAESPTAYSPSSTAAAGGAGRAPSPPLSPSGQGSRSLPLYNDWSLLSSPLPTMAVGNPAPVVYAGMEPTRISFRPQQALTEPLVVELTSSSPGLVWVKPATLIFLPCSGAAAAPSPSFNLSDFLGLSIASLGAGPAAPTPGAVEAASILTDPFCAAGVPPPAQFAMLWAPADAGVSVSAGFSLYVNWTARAAGSSGQEVARSRSVRGEVRSSLPGTSLFYPLRIPSLPAQASTDFNLYAANDSFTSWRVGPFIPGIYLSLVPAESTGLVVLTCPGDLAASASADGNDPAAPPTAAAAAAAAKTTTAVRSNLYNAGWGPLSGLPRASVRADDVGPGCWRTLAMLRAGSEVLPVVYPAFHFRIPGAGAGFSLPVSYRLLSRPLNETLDDLLDVGAVTAIETLPWRATATFADDGDSVSVLVSLGERGPVTVNITTCQPNTTVATSLTVYEAASLQPVAESGRGGQAAVSDSTCSEILDLVLDGETQYIVGVAAWGSLGTSVHRDVERVASFLISRGDDAGAASPPPPPPA